MTKYQCYCNDCNSKIPLGKNEQQLHLFIGSNNADCFSEWKEFENGLHFGSVIHWDVGCLNSPRYFIYLNSIGECIAWYDNAYKNGYKNLRGISQRHHNL